MISEFALALAKKGTMTDLANVLHAYPSYSWAVQLMAAEVYSGKLASLYRSIASSALGKLLGTVLGRLLRPAPGALPKP